MTDPAFRLYRLTQERPFLAWRAGPTTITEALHRMPMPTRRRHQWSRVIAAQTRLGTQVLPSHHCRDPLLHPFGLGTDELTERGSKALGERVHVQLICWSPNSRRPRAYGLLSSRESGRAMFLKVTLKGDRAMLQNEARTLADLNGRHGEFATPRFACTFETNLASALVTSMPSLGARRPRSVPLDKLLRLVAPARGSVNMLADFEWWDGWLKSGGLGSRARSYRALGTQKVVTGLVHGDLTPANMLMDGYLWWLLDWEMSETHGPVWVDLITSAWPTRTGSPTASGTRLIRKAFAVDQASTVGALVFMASRGHEGASLHLQRGILSYV
jgi:hypothetical protein